MAVVRHIALDVLKNYPAKISLARKRRRCTYDDDFLANVLLSVRSCVSRDIAGELLALSGEADSEQLMIEDVSV